jgi:hypothetical protein
MGSVQRRLAEPDEAEQREHDHDHDFNDRHHDGSLPRMTHPAYARHAATDRQFSHWFRRPVVVPEDLPKPP